MSKWGAFLKMVRYAALAVLCVSVASCATTNSKPEKKKRPKEYFAESEYGVKASPRVHYGKDVPKGGGRRQLGKPYVVKGKRYVPKEDFGYNKKGLASWYGSAFHGRLTANGEIYDQYHLSAAHPTFPLPSYARVTNLDNGTSLIVRVNDRGPYHPGRIIDLSDKAAEMLDMKHHGTAKVRVQYVGKAPLEGNDMPYLMASYRQKGDRIDRQPQIATGVMVASNEAAIGMDDDSLTSTRTALAETRRSAVADSFDEVTDFAVLPDIGPVPEERPEIIYRLAAHGKTDLVSGYAEFRIRQSTEAFDAVLAGSRLDAKAIRDSVARRQIGEAKNGPKNGP